MFKRRKPDDTIEPGAAPPQASDAGLTEGLLAAGVPEPRMAARPDSGLGVPPYRPILPKEAPMGRAPYPAPAPPAPPPSPAPGMALQQRPAPQPTRPREPQERRTLVVGRGISVQGTVADAERLVVEGTVEASMIHAAELSIAQGGVFKGEVEVEDAEIAGVIDGTLTARGNLIVRATGQVLGTARCRRLQVEDGGQISGRMEMLTDNARETPRVEAMRSDNARPDAPRAEAAL